MIINRPQFDLRGTLNVGMERLHSAVVIFEKKNNQRPVT